MIDIASFSAGALLMFIAMSGLMIATMRSATRKVEEATAILNTADKMMDAVIDWNNSEEKSDGNT